MAHKIIANVLVHISLKVLTSFVYRMEHFREKLLEIWNNSINAYLHPTKVWEMPPSDWDKSISESDLMHNSNDFECGTICGKTTLQKIDCCIYIGTNWSYRLLKWFLAQLQYRMQSIWIYLVIAFKRWHTIDTTVRWRKTNKAKMTYILIFMLLFFVCLCVMRCGSIEI